MMIMMNSTKAQMPVTSIPMMEATAVQTEEPKTVYLTRPYLCVIFDHETQSIVFLGIVNRVDG